MTSHQMVSLCVVVYFLMTVSSSSSSAQELRARVVGGTAEAGRLEIFYDGVWNTVCDNGFGQEDALVACRMLGFNSTTVAAVGPTKYGAGSGPILFSNLQCVGNETSLAQCKHPVRYIHDYSYDCDHSDDVGVACNMTHELRARVVGGTAEAGRLEIFYDGVWSTVCRDEFGQEEALVACRMLGFNSTTAAAVGSDKYGQGSGPILFDNLECVGNETSLAQCKHAGLYRHNCEHFEDVGVVCNIISSVWGQWGTWSDCSATCGDGTRSRQRTCSVTQGACPGEATQTETCNITACCVPKNGQWTDWSSWSPCSQSCGKGFRSKSRTCSEPNACGRPCEGNNFVDEPCNLQACSVADEELSVKYQANNTVSHNETSFVRGVDRPAPNQASSGKTWGAWGSWTCSITCGRGRESRTRTCTPGARCAGDASQTQECQRPACCVPRHGQWNTWDSWSSCSPSCGQGTQTRSRTCNGLNNCGQPCQGDLSQSRACNVEECPMTCPADVIKGSNISCTCRTRDLRKPGGRLLLFFNDRG